MTYSLYEYTVPEYTFEKMQAYVNDGLPVGGFLTAVIENNLAEAVGRADDANLKNLPAIVGWFYNQAPASCWGSPGKYDAWLQRFAVKRALELVKETAE